MISDTNNTEIMKKKKEIMNILIFFTLKKLQAPVLISKVKSYKNNFEDRDIFLSVCASET